MEYLNEAVILSVDWLILGLCLKEYYSYKNTVKALKVNSNFRPKKPKPNL